MLIHHSGLIGGAGVSLLHTWEALKDKYDVTVYVPDTPSDFLNMLKSKGLNPKTYSFQIGTFSNYSGGTHLKNPKFWGKLALVFLQSKYWNTQFDEEKPDLVIVNSKVLCWMGILLKKKNIKSLCFVRETMPGSPRRLVNRIMNKILRSFTSVAFISQYDCDLEQLSESKCIISPDFMAWEEQDRTESRVESCKSLNIPIDTFKVLYVGGVNKMKGFETAIHAINELKSEKITLVVAGAPYLEIKSRGLKAFYQKCLKRKAIQFSKSMKKYIEVNKLENYIHFVGYQTDMKNCFLACDTLIFPMVFPHQARPAFEIGYYRKPVIISDFPNIREYVIDGNNGLTFEPNNSKELASAILRFKNSENLLNQIGLNNYYHAIHYHSKDYAITALEKGIDKILN